MNSNLDDILKEIRNDDDILSEIESEYENHFCFMWEVLGGGEEDGRFNISSYSLYCFARYFYERFGGANAKLYYKHYKKWHFEYALRRNARIVFFKKKRSV